MHCMSVTRGSGIAEGVGERAVALAQNSLGHMGHSASTATPCTPLSPPGTLSLGCQEAPSLPLLLLPP